MSRLQPTELQYRAPSQPCEEQAGSRRASFAKRTLLAVMAALLVPTLQACKIHVEVPEGGRVVSESGSYRCLHGDFCEIDLVDVFFDETFIAKPKEGWQFMGWEKVPAALCAESMSPCNVSTIGLEQFEQIDAILASDSIFYLRPIFEPIPVITEDDVEPEGKVIDTENGFEVDGALTISDGDGLESKFRNARLELDFNASGELEKLDGQAILPRELTKGFRLDGDFQADVGLYTGAEINANDEIGITLLDERQYLVFFMGTDISYSWDDQVPTNGPKGVRTETRQIKMNTPASGKIIMIQDLNDRMVYRYGETPLKGAFGEAESDQGLIPFVPFIDGHAKVDRFLGQKYKTISVGVGIKALDVFNLTGEQVTYQPSYFDIDLSDPFNDRIAYRAGFNGSAQVAISVFGFSVDDWFEFDLGEASASFDVSKRRQAMTLVSNLEPDVRWLPDWVPFLPTGRLGVELFASGTGEASLLIEGEYRSVIPSADLTGAFRVAPNGLTLSGEIDSDFVLPAEISFRDGNTYGEVFIEADFSDQIDAGVEEGFDRAQAELDEAMARLEDAVADYEIELSLRGLRASLPAISDSVIRELNRVPGIVYDEVYSKVKKGIDDNNVCILGVCAVSNSTRNSKARSAASSARSQASSAIAPYISMLNELKRSALEDNEATLVASLEAALRAAYANRRFKKTFTVSVSVAGFTVRRSHTVDETILSSSQAEQILFAADNVHRIPETSDRVISAQEIVDRIPAQEAIDRARQRVEEGVAQIPTVESVTYTVIDDQYSAGVVFGDGSRYELNLNVFDWYELSRGIAKIISDQLVGGGD